jgi:hexosaminidase
MKLFACLLSLASLAAAAPHGVIPKPIASVAQEETFALSAQTAVRSTRNLRAEANYLLEEIEKITGFRHRFMPLNYRGKIPGSVHLEKNIDLEPGHYTVEFEPLRAVISGHDTEAIFHGIQTFLQIAPAERVKGFYPFSCVNVSDRPGSADREVQLDVARHIIPNDELKDFIDLLAFHKFNKLSLRLNDDQGWRLESKKYPKLTTIGSVRASTPPYGDRFGSDEEEYRGYYTQELIREIVAHAKSRHIEIIPVISLPAHVSAVLASYPELGNSDLGGEKPTVRTDWADSSHLLAPKPETFAFIEDLLTEIAALFPASTIAINDHQPSLDEWKKSPAAQAYLEKNDLNDEAALWHHFLAHAKTSIENLGRTPRLESTQKILRFDQYQRPEAEELAADEDREAAGGLLTLADVYQAESAIAVFPGSYLHDIEKLHYMAFPRLAALSEVLWTPAENRSFEDFNERLPNLLAHYKKRKVAFGEPYVTPNQAALHGTKVTTTLGHHLQHWPELAFDGDKKTFFWSDRALQKGDHLTLTFPHPIEGNIEVATGGDASDDGAALTHGVLEVSSDGKTWNALGEFVDGLATLTAPAGTTALRIRVTGPQEEALIIHEIILSEPLLPAKLSETRSAKLNAQVTVEMTFRCNFTDHPEFREKVAQLRRRYFSLWPRACNFLGVIGQPGTPDTLSIAFGNETSLKAGVLTFDREKFATQSLEETEGQFISYLCTYLQNYGDGTPDWFASGLTTIIRQKELPNSAWAKALPREPRKSDATTGGAGSAAFLNWITKEHTAFPLSQISLICRTKYDPRYWEITTHKTLEKLVEEYQK